MYVNMPKTDILRNIIEPFKKSLLTEMKYS